MLYYAKCGLLLEHAVIGLCSVHSAVVLWNLFSNAHHDTILFFAIICSLSPQVGLLRRTCNKHNKKTKLKPRELRSTASVCLPFLSLYLYVILFCITVCMKAVPTRAVSRFCERSIKLSLHYACATERWCPWMGTTIQHKTCNIIYIIYTTCARH